MIKKAITHIQQDAFLKSNVIFFVGSIVIAFFNYLYHPVMSRLMTIERFGEVQTIFSLVFLSGVILTVFNRIVLHITANAHSTAPDGARGAAGAPHERALIHSLYTAACLIHLPFIILLIVASPAISHFFAFETSWSFAIFAVGYALSIPASFYGAYLQGRHEFAALSISQVISSGGKLAIAVLLVVLNAGVFGAVAAIAIASFLSIVYMRRRAHGFTLHFVPIGHIMPALKKEIPYGFLVLMSLGLVTFLYSADVLVVKRLFNPEIAGMYSGVAAIARIIFFATASIGAVLLSSIKIRNTEAENRAILKKAATYVGIIGGGILLVFSLFPSTIISLMIGAKYVPMAHLLPLFSVYILLISFLSLFVTYLLAQRAQVLLPIAFAGLCSVSVLISMSHASPEAIIYDFILCTAMTLVFVAAAPALTKKYYE